MDTAELTEKILSAIANRNRIRILMFLRDGEKCVCEIYPALSLEQSNLSKHLKILTDAGILEFRKEKNSVYYNVKDKRVFEILEMAKKIMYDNIIDISKSLQSIKEGKQ